VEKEHGLLPTRIAKLEGHLELEPTPGATTAAAVGQPGVPPRWHCWSGPQGPLGTTANEETVLEEPTTAAAVVAAAVVAVAAAPIPATTTVVPGATSAPSTGVSVAAVALAVAAVVVHP